MEYVLVISDDLGLLTEHTLCLTNADSFFAAVLFSDCARCGESHWLCHCVWCKESDVQVLQVTSHSLRY